MGKKRKKWSDEGGSLNDLIEQQQARQAIQQQQGQGAWEREVLQGTINGHEVTAIVGKQGTDREGHTLIADGILGNTPREAKEQLDARHDHFSRDSKLGDNGDRGHSNVPNT